MPWHDASTWVKSESLPCWRPNTAWESHPGAVPPTHPVRELCGKAGVSSVTLCRPLSYGPTSRPSREDGGTLERGTDAYSALGQDDVVTLGQRGVSSPSPPPCAAIPAAVPPSRALQHHPWHCGGWDDGTPPHRLLCDPRPSVSPTLELTYEQRLNKRIPCHHPRSRS
jgi:hypothetical protein